MAKLDRLLNLTAALLDAQVPLTAEEIRERVPGYSGDSDEAFRRTFERDKDDLRELGVPVETVGVGRHEQPRAAYTIERDRYELPDPGLDPDELAALHLAATTVQLEGLDPADADDALRKLGGLPAAAAASGGTLGEVPAPGPLLECFVAVVERRVISFDYGGDRRQLQPWRLQFERGRWYVTGHDLDREDRRSFRLDRIQGPIEAGPADGFEQVPGDDSGVRLRPWEYGDADAVEATVLLDADIAATVLTEHPGLVVDERRGDGSVLVRLTVRNPTALRDVVLSWLDRAELIAPEHLRSDITDWLSAFEASR